MKIRTQVYIVLAGVIAIPVLAFTALQAVNQYRWNQFKTAAEAAAATERSQIASRMTERFGERWREGPPPVIFPGGINAEVSPAGTSPPAFTFTPRRPNFALTPGIPGIPLAPGAISPPGALPSGSDDTAPAAGSAGDKTHHAEEPRRALRNGAPYVRTVYPAPPKVPWPLIFAGILGTLFAFCAIILVTMARSIGSAVTNLGEATARIASGDLDSPVDVKGSNEIAALSHALDSMRSALKEAAARRSRFIMGVSHDLRTPLSLVKGYTEALFDGTAHTAEERDAATAIISDKIGQLQELIDDLIDVVRLDSGEWRSRLKPHALQPILEAFLKRLTADGALLSRVVTGGVSVGGDIAVPLDHRMFTRMLENITGNALRYTDVGGVVDFTAAVDTTGDPSVVIRVVDNGCGIAASDLPYIFDTFYRGTNSRREEGKGFGLSIVKSVADSYGWAVNVESTEGAGSCFTIRIPL